MAVHYPKASTGQNCDVMCANLFGLFCVHCRQICRRTNQFVGVCFRVEFYFSQCLLHLGGTNQQRVAFVWGSWGAYVKYSNRWWIVYSSIVFVSSEGGIGFAVLHIRSRFSWDAYIQSMTQNALTSVMIWTYKLGTSICFLIQDTGWIYAQAQWFWSLDLVLS